MQVTNIIGSLENFVVDNVENVNDGRTESVGPASACSLPHSHPESSSSLRRIFANHPVAMGSIEDRFMLKSGRLREMDLSHNSPLALATANCGSEYVAAQLREQKTAQTLPPRFTMGWLCRNF